MRAILVLLLLLAVSLAGCTGDADDDPIGNDGPDDTDPGTDPTDNGDPDPGPIVYNATSVEFYLESGGLALEAPSDGTVPLVGISSMFGVGSLSGAEFASGEFGLPMRVPSQDVSVSVWLQTDAVGVGNPVFDLAAWIGTSKGELGFAFISNVVLQPGPAQEAVINLRIPHTVVLPAGESITTRVIGMYQPDAAGLHNIAVGESTPSGLAVTLQPLDADIPEEGDVELLSVDGQIVGGQFANCDAGDTIHRFTVPDDANVIDIQLTATNAVPGAVTDVDLDLYDGNTQLWHAGSPYTSEQIFVAGPALEDYRGKELGVAPSICMGPVANYSIDVYTDVESATA